jgi:hypothetical protein
MLPVLRRILDDAVVQFQRTNVRAGRDSLIFIIDRYRKLLQHVDLIENDASSLFNRKRLLITSLEILQREVRVLSRRIDTTLLSVRTDQRGQNRRV